MRKLFALILLCVMLSVCLCGCGNRDMWDTVYTYDRCMISLPNGEVVEGKVESWSDYENSDQIQVKVDGKYYLVHSTNIVLISE